MNLTDLTNLLGTAQARWTARQTPVALLDDAQQRALLGAIPSESALAAVAAMAAGAPAAPAATFPPMVDWRANPANHVSPVKDQGGCGSCVSFACVATTESVAHIDHGRWVNLSEADSHFCSNHGPNCGGWWPDQCFDQMRLRGVSDENCFPYPSAFPGGDIWSGPPTCKLCADRNTRTARIGGFIPLPDPVSAKNHLAARGPVAGCLDVYQDFFSYEGGVYSHVSGPKMGGHCVQVIGYSEAEACWIIKNSWNTSWGMAGFGKVAYADMVFNGQFYPMYGVSSVAIPDGIGDD